jgi:sporulation protein YlmC with PRC-barrel domain
MKGREYHEDAFVGVIGKNIETEGGDKVGKVTDVLITKGTKEIVVKVSQGLLKSDMVVPWSKVVKVTEDTVVVSDRYYEGEAEGEVELQ